MKSEVQVPVNPQVLLSVLGMLSAAEGPVIQLVHDLLVGTGGKSDQATLVADAADWKDLQAKATAALAS